MAAKVDQIHITDGWLIVKKKGVKRYFNYKNEEKSASLLFTIYDE